MKTDPETGILHPFDFNDIYEEFPAVGNLGVEIDVIMFKPIDSSNVSPDIWVELAELLKDNYTEYDGFVILHGTDTMSYTASMLSFMLENLDKPIVFTGSQIPMGVMRTDGRENLITAIEIAASKTDGRGTVPEVSLYFQNKLFRGNRTLKYSVDELSAFRSENYPSLADVGINIEYNHRNIHTPEFPTVELDISTKLDTDVAVVKLFPGINENTFRAMMSIEGVKAIVLETFGIGNAPTFEWFIEVVRETLERGVPIINVTQCQSGKVAMDVYETGIELQHMGVISGYDSTTEAAVTKLMYLLGKGLEGEELRRCMKYSIRGEITV